MFFQIEFWIELFVCIMSIVDFDEICKVLHAIFYFVVLCELIESYFLDLHKVVSRNFFGNPFIFFRKEMKRIGKVFFFTKIWIKHFDDDVRSCYQLMQLLALIISLLTKHGIMLSSYWVLDCFVQYETDCSLQECQINA